MNQQNPYLIPLSIIVGGILIAGAVLYTQGQPSEKSFVSQVKDSQERQDSQPFGNNGSALAKKALPIASNEYIRGNPEAQVALIEFSDLQCPFCRQFHSTMQQVLREFNGKVKWVYRHFPLVSIHPEAFPAALASECAAQLGGNEAFWAFVDRVFENQGLMGSNLYRQIVSDLGLDGTEYDKCFSEKRFQDKVQKDLDQAVASGGRGTPYSIIVDQRGNVFPFSGTLPFERIKPLLDQALSDN